VIAEPAAADPVSIVFQNGRSVPVNAVALQGDKLTITASVPNFNVGQTFSFASADHIYGMKPPEINQAVALLLTDKPADALKLLEPIVAEQRITSKIPGNFWLEAARAALIAYAMNGNAAKCMEIGKEVSDATPAQGIDPFVSLGKAILLPASTPVADRELAFKDLTTDNLAAEVCAYASFLRAKLLKSVKRNSDAAKASQQDADVLEGFLTAPCVYPAGCMIVNAAAEIQAADYLVILGRREEAVALLKSAIRQAPETILLAEANKRLESIK
jgi:tetratricopeptide (TPR) repeat protein